MKVFAFAALLPALTSGYVILGGTNSIRRPMTLQATERDCYSPGSDPEEDVRRWEQQFDHGCADPSADEAFENLINEMNSAADSPRDVQKQKDWVRRAFGVAAEFNRDVANSEEQVKRNEEMLRKQQKWVDKIIDFASDLSQDFSPPADSKPVKDTENVQEQAVATEQGDFTMTPSYTINDDDDAFQVALELPGVQLSDISIDVDTELQTLTISGERQMIGNDGNIKFSKTFGLDPSVRVDEITASLSNGILLVNALKEAKPEKGKTMKIPITSEE